MSIEWKCININDLPSMGKFYPKGTTIHIKAIACEDIFEIMKTSSNDIFFITKFKNKINSEIIIPPVFPGELDINSLLNKAIFKN